MVNRQKQNLSPHPTNTSRNPADPCQTKPATPPNGSLPTKLYIKLAKHREGGGAGQYSPGVSSALTQIVPYSSSLYTVFHSVIHSWASLIENLAAEDR